MKKRDDFQNPGDYDYLIRISERIRQVCEDSGLKQKDLAEKIGIAAGYLSEIRSGKKFASDKLVRLICQCFAVNETWIKTGEGERYINVERLRPKSTIQIHEIPVLGRISAGFPSIAAEEILEYISIPGTPENSFALVVKGPSMEPTFRDGDYVLFIENGEYKANDVLIVLDEWGEAMVKRLKLKEGRKFLISDNAAYPVIEPNEHYRIIGKVVKVWRDIRF